MNALERGEYGQPGNGPRSVIVGFREKAKGEIADNPTASTKYIVFVEQSGGTTRLDNWKPE